MKFVPSNPTPTGQRVKLARERLGWSGLTLAIKAGVSAASIYNLERGLCRKPKLATLSRLAEALGLNIGELLPEQVQDA